MNDNNTDKTRKPVRLSGYDYSSSGVYFLTICVKSRDVVLSKVTGEVREDCLHDNINLELTGYGEIIKNQIDQINEYDDLILIDRYVIMPDHVHIMIRNEYQSGEKSIPQCVAFFKRKCNSIIGENIWQRGFYDHIIRDEEDYNNHCFYIDENPKKFLMGKDDYYR